MPKSGWQSVILMLALDTTYIAKYTTLKNGTIRTQVVYAVGVLNSEIRRGDFIGLEFGDNPIVFHLGHYSITLLFISEGE